MADDFTVRLSVLKDEPPRHVTMAEIDKLRESANEARSHLVWLRNMKKCVGWEGGPVGALAERQRVYDFLVQEARTEYEMYTEAVSTKLKLYWQQNGI